MLIYLLYFRRKYAILITSAGYMMLFWRANYDAECCFRIKEFDLGGTNSMAKTYDKKVDSGTMSNIIEELNVYIEWSAYWNIQGTMIGC